MDKITKYNSSIKVMFNDKKKLYYIAAPLVNNKLIDTDRGVRYEK